MFPYDNLITHNTLIANPHAPQDVPNAKLPDIANDRTIETDPGEWIGMYTRTPTEA
jgi:hypothetical protein